MAALILCALAVFSTLPARAQQTSEQYRLSELERRANITELYGPRLSVVEIHYEELREQLSDIKTWTRAIAMALLVAIVEKLFGAFGVRFRRRPEVGD